jgi:uncharacterized protein
VNRAVFDTSVLIAAAISHTGSPFKCLDLVRRTLAESVTCAEILDEFRRKLVDKLAYPPDYADARVQDIRNLSTVVTIEGRLRLVESDPKDDKIIEWAVAGNATHIVTGDRRPLLPLREHQGIPIITPPAFLATVLAE